MMRHLSVFTSLAILSMLLSIQPCAAAPAAAGVLDLAAQSENIQGWVDVALGPQIAPWDDSVAMIGRGKHHSSRQAMLYAAGLILRNRPEDIEHAQRAIRAVLKLQYNAPGRSWHGTYKTDELQPDRPAFRLVERAYDENWREFISSAQIVLLEACPARLDAALREEMLAAIRRACEGAHKRAVAWRYTNIALMSAHLLAWGGHQFEEPAWSRHGAELAGEIYAEFCRTGAFMEYNSPTYAGTDLYGLALWRTLPAFPEMGKMAREMEAGLWRDLALHYHAGLRNLCGPFDRSYGMDMGKYVAKSSICIALALDLPAALPDPLKVDHHEFEMGFAPLMAVLGMNMPEDAAPHFREFQGERRFVQIIDAGDCPRTAQSWLEKDFMVGAEQTSGKKYPSSTAHPFTLHWKTPDGDVAWVRMLHDTPVEACIEGDTVVFTQTRKLISRKPQYLEFEVLSPGAATASFQPARWDLQGISLSVDRRLSPPSITAKDGRFIVSYPLGVLASPGPCLKLRIRAADPAAATGGNMAIIPIPRDRPRWIQRHQSMSDRMARGDAGVLWIGDSIVERWEGPGKPLWDKYYAQRNAVNLGISGDNTEHVLWRLDNCNLERVSPKLAIVMIGQNNGPSNTAEEIADGVTAIVTKLRQTLPEMKILVLGVFFRGEKPNDEQIKLAKTNDILSKLEDGQHIFYMNINKIFLRPDGTIPKSLMPDCEHPNWAGCKIWAETIEPKVAELLGETAIMAD